MRRREDRGGIEFTQLSQFGIGWFDLQSDTTLRFSKRRVVPSASTTRSFSWDPQQPTVPPGPSSENSTFNALPSPAFHPSAMEISDLRASSIPALAGRAAAGAAAGAGPAGAENA